GTGDLTVRTSQDPTIFSGLPPLVRTGDYYGASFTLRNASDRPMTATATDKLNPEVAQGAPLTVTLPAGAAARVRWSLPAPPGEGRLDWTVEARSAGGKAVDRISVRQEVAPAVPIETWAASILQVAPNGTQVPIMAPAGALPGIGSVDVKL